MHTVLVVEDDEELAEIVGDMLRLSGYSVVRASNGADALSLLTETTPSVILLDMMMPVMNGAEFMAQRARDARLSSIPVIILSASLEFVDSGRFGTTPCIAKPFDFSVLISTIERECANART